MRLTESSPSGGAVTKAVTIVNAEIDILYSAPGE